MTLIARHGPEWTSIDYHQFFLMNPDQEDFIPEEYGKLISPTGETVIVHAGSAHTPVAATPYTT
ncbi:hypothetical protein ACFOY4_22215 [Actinomadura syzygii]|uniref:Uncharacterized protein n=1 Tax=Actinomadura syzygii TaxID=1427538 RepID=A0A5D0TWM1_9ACTN|nr:hypothetical protein [Actinomadura syzygii]TYC09780.1 hypothetical protein FXF65_32145 [Actinomadura syzygii]